MGCPAGTRTKRLFWIVRFLLMASIWDLIFGYDRNHRSSSKIMIIIVTINFLTAFVRTATPSVEAEKRVQQRIPAGRQAGFKAGMVQCGQSPLDPPYALDNAHMVTHRPSMTSGRGMRRSTKRPLVIVLEAESEQALSRRDPSWIASSEPASPETMDARCRDADDADSPTPSVPAVHLGPRLPHAISGPGFGCESLGYDRSNPEAPSIG
ncbi:predicted protein [Uncinocarpus reesii 1704]|uniref:Uncharacterized protein n=1 Tax=Uncinocarpus reesii (strain UAMH 1704) TaxID=336963 RepID=C4JKZ0_UNCRE|nr:uncharacterized protein UREG_00190 [Uncinocarpus reesii 1704]EEP75344.1 predicted protein [Uncinocarpus reesii 1704]